MLGGRGFSAAGEFDYLEGVGEVSESRLFQGPSQQEGAGETGRYLPIAVPEHDVPLWVYIAGDISMRFHGVHQFKCFPLRDTLRRDDQCLWSCNGT